MSDRPSIDDYYSDDKVFRCSGRGDSLEVSLGHRSGFIVSLQSFDAPNLSASITDLQAVALVKFLTERLARQRA